MELKIGGIYKVAFPFIHGEYSGFDEDGLFCEHTWIPGCNKELAAIDFVEYKADGQGFMLLKIIDLHKPGKFPTRVFYTRSFVDPDGKVFGSGRLHITTVPTFKKRSSNYHHEYTIK